MPVKVRCPGCDKVLNAPDAARGKAVKCPQCETRIRVPDGNGAAESPRVPTLKRSGTATASKPAGKRPARRAADEDDFLGGLDLNRVEDQRNRVCQKCGTEVSSEDIECPKCGINLATGILSDKMARKLSRRGPDPAEFYGVVWKDSWQFLMKNKGLAWTTGFAWSTFVVLYLCSIELVAWCEGIWTKLFWLGLAVLWYLGTPGWYWFLSNEVIENTMTSRKPKTLKDVRFDFLATVALGIKAIFWIPFIVHTFPPIALILPVVFPIALVHMSRRYTYPAWIGWEMLLATLKNFLPALYWCIISTVVNIPSSLFAGGWMFGGFFVRARYEESVDSWTLSLMDANLESPGFLGWIAIGAIRLLLNIVIIAPAMLAIAFPAVFAMRANGLLGYYNARNLNLIDDRPRGQPCGFWPRYIAALVDFILLPLVTILVWKDRMASMIGWMINIITFASWYLVGPELTGIVASSLTFPYYNWMYFATQEGSKDQATIGKLGMGIIVTDLEGNPLTLKQASGRWASKLVSGLTFGIGFIMAGITPRKQALHDSLAKTLVVWRGESEAEEH